MVEAVCGMYIAFSEGEVNDEIALKYFRNLLVKMHLLTFVLWTLVIPVQGYKYQALLQETVSPKLHLLITFHGRKSGCLKHLKWKYCFVSVA